MSLIKFRRGSSDELTPPDEITVMEPWHSFDIASGPKVQYENRGAMIGDEIGRRDTGMLSGAWQVGRPPGERPGYRLDVRTRLVGAANRPIPEYRYIRMEGAGMGAGRGGSRRGRSTRTETTSRVARAAASALRDAAIVARKEKMKADAAKRAMELAAKEALRAEREAANAEMMDEEYYGDEYDEDYYGESSGGSAPSLHSSAVITRGPLARRTGGSGSGRAVNIYDGSWYNSRVRPSEAPGYRLLFGPIPAEGWVRFRYVKGSESSVAPYEEDEPYGSSGAIEMYRGDVVGYWTEIK